VLQAWVSNLNLARQIKLPHLQGGEGFLVICVHMDGGIESLLKQTNSKLPRKHSNVEKPCSSQKQGLILFKIILMNLFGCRLDLGRAFTRELLSHPYNLGVGV
jgi:hypothetical protein